MSYQQDIYEAFKASAALTALVGDRFFWDVAEQGTPTPYLVAQVISASGRTDLSGERSLTFPLIQIAAWDKTKSGAIALMATVKAELEGRNLPGGNNVSLGFDGEQSTRDPVTKLYGEIYDYRASANSN